MLKAKYYDSCLERLSVLVNGANDEYLHKHAYIVTTLRVNFRYIIVFGRWRSDCSYNHHSDRRCHL